MANNVNDLHKDSLTTVQKMALWITSHVGTMGFFIVILFWTMLWLGWNILAPTNLQFDPEPAFVFWLFISNMIQICLMPLIMIGQNIQAQHAEILAEENYAINVKAEQEIEVILTKIDYLTNLVRK